LATTSRQFSQVTNQLQVVTEVVAQLRDTKAKLSQDLDGKSNGSLLSLSGSPLVPYWTPIHWPWLQGHT
jgi:hypothetical protein